MLVIETDDMRWDELKFMPQVRRLIMHRGLHFVNSFAPYPLCCPSRASFLSGKYAHNHHVLSHVDPFGFTSFDDHLTLATELQKHGYQTALVGKYLNGYARQKIHGTDRSPCTTSRPGGTSGWRAATTSSVAVALHGGTYNYFSMTQNVNGASGAAPRIYSSKLTAEQVQRTIKAVRRHRQAVVRVVDPGRPALRWAARARRPGSDPAHRRELTSSRPPRDRSACADLRRDVPTRSATRLRPGGAGLTTSPATSGRRR